MDTDFKFQWMFQRLLKNIIPGVMFDYMESVRARAAAVQKENDALQTHLDRGVTNRHGRSA
jgi:hypothetical protein